MTISVQFCLLPVIQTENCMQFQSRFVLIPMIRRIISVQMFSFFMIKVRLQIPSYSIGLIVNQDCPFLNLDSNKVYTPYMRDWVNNKVIEYGENYLKRKQVFAVSSMTFRVSFPILHLYCMRILYFCLLISRMKGIRNPSFEEQIVHI